MNNEASEPVRPSKT